MLLSRLKAIQEALGLSDRKFSAVLGIDDSLWTYTRQGKTPIRFRVLQGALRAFPDNEALKRDVLAFLSQAEEREGELAQAG
jgi:transcriptional regulator with XRE-family HTH domain